MLKRLYENKHLPLCLMIRAFALLVPLQQQKGDIHWAKMTGGGGGRELT